MIVITFSDQTLSYNLAIRVHHRLASRLFNLPAKRNY